MDDIADNENEIIWVFDGDGSEERFERDTQIAMAKWDAEHAAAEASNATTTDNKNEIVWVFDGDGFEEENQRQKEELKAKWLEERGEDDPSVKEDFERNRQRLLAKWKQKAKQAKAKVFNTTTTDNKNEIVLVMDDYSRSNEYIFENIKKYQESLKEPKKVKRVVKKTCRKAK